ncbi:MAG: M15 family metallopeptidase [Deltaproteobacteria bacterium]|nr:M15 family metallopeptidase [Deltaproteobacteria bacterium]
MLAKKLLGLFVFGLVCGPMALTGCASDVGDDDDDDGETEPVGETNDELRSGVSCKERTEVAYRAGVRSTIQVITVGGKPVAKPAGHAFLKMQAAAHAAGIKVSLTSGFRTMAEQEYLYNCYKTRRCNNGNLAAKPGYSNHQNGVALDISTSAWLAKNAGKFGFVRTVAKEPWHYEFRGADPGGPCSRVPAADDTTDEQGGVDDSVPRDQLGLPSVPDALDWVMPYQDATLKNGFTVQAKTKVPQIVKVEFSQGTLTFGTSTTKDASGVFSLAYSFNYMGDKTLTAKGFDAAGKLVSEDHVDFTVVPRDSASAN